jgi:glycosyltransferase involved in cell wall biosynthesis
LVELATDHISCSFYCFLITCIETWIIKRSLIINIFHIVESTATGTLSMLKVLANSQADRGHKVTVLYSAREETPKNLEELFEPTISLIYVDMNSVLSKMKAIFQLRKLVNDTKPDNVFLHSSFAGFIGRVALLGKKITPFYIPHCISFMQQDVGMIKKVLFISFECLGALKNCVYIACSKSEQAEIKKFIPFRDCKLIENAIDTSKWQSKGTNPRDKVVITVGQIREQKGPESFAKIANLSKGLGFKFIWVGDGNDEAAKRTLRNANVDILGWKNSDEVKYLLNSSLIYLSTAKWEGLPVSPLEAMISGCAVVLSNCAGNKDIINHNENGFLFNNEQECLKILDSLASNENLVNKIALAGAEHVKKQYDLSRYITQFEELTY